MKYSITIPAYKAAFLRECLESVLSQTYDSYEVIILNDCSPEDLEGVVNEFRSHKNWDKIRYYENEKNVGAVDVVDNWNKLLRLAEGDFLICMGDDDILDKNCLDEYNALMEKYPLLDVYHARTMMIDENSNFCNLQEERPERQSVYSLIWHYTFKEGVQFVGDFLYRISAMRRNGGFHKLPLAWCSDCTTAFKAAASNGIANTINPVFYYRQNKSSITSSANIKLKMQATKMYLDWMLDFLNNVPENEMDKRYWHLITVGFKSKIQHHEVYMIGADIKNHFFSGFWYWLKARKGYSLSLSQFFVAVGIGLATKFR